jgi:thymidine kinase
MIGAQECYEARSREHFKIDKKPLDEYIEKLKKLTS